MSTPDHFLPTERRAVYLLILLLVIGGLLVHFRLDPARLADRLLAKEQTDETEEAAAPVEKGDYSFTVEGAVAVPGTYSLPAGSYVANAILEAGGLLPAADPDGLELTRTLEPNETITVPERSAEAEKEKLSSETRFRLEYYGAERIEKLKKKGLSPHLKVDLNTADVKELSALPFIGNVTAARIIEYRSTRGPFGEVGELDRVQGIGKVTLERVRPFVEVSR